MSVSMINNVLPLNAPLSAANATPPSSKLPKQFSNETFTEVISYLTADQKMEIYAKLSQLPDTDRLTQEVADALNQNNLLSPILLNKDFYFYALLALEKGLITGMAFTTAQIFHNTASEHQLDEMQIVPLFKDNQVNPEASDMVDQTSEILSDVKFATKELRTKAVNAILAQKGVPNPQLPSYLSPQEKAKFFEIMKTLPPLEQQYLVVPDNRSRVVSNDLELIINDHILQSLAVRGCGILSRFTINGRQYLAMPSKGMVQAYLIAKFGDNAVTMVTREGLAPFEDMQNMILKGQRPAAIDSSMHPIDKADGYKLVRKFNECFLHDVYHAILMSYIPKEERLKCYGIGVLFQKALKELHSVGEIEDLQAMYASMIDMEHSHYRAMILSGRPITAKVFWETLFFKFAQDNKISKATISKAIAKELVENGDEYRSKYNLGADSLDKLYSQLDFLAHNSLIKSLKTFLNEKVENISFDQLTNFVMNKIKLPEIPLLDLIKIIKNGKSYLVRDAAADTLKIRLASLEFPHQLIQEVWKAAEKIGSAQALYVIRDFIIDRFESFINAQSKLDPKFIEFIRPRLQTAVAFENLIKTAIQTKNRKQVEFLLYGESAIRENINKQFSDGFTLMQSAVFAEDQAMVEYLLSLGAKPNLQKGQMSCSPIMISVSMKNDDLTQLLTLKGGSMTTNELQWMEDAMVNIEKLQRKTDEAAMIPGVVPGGKWTFEDYAKLIAVKEYDRGVNKFLPVLDTVKTNLDDPDVDK